MYFTSFSELLILSYQNIKSSEEEHDGDTSHRGMGCAHKLSKGTLRLVLTSMNEVCPTHITPQA